MSNDNKDRKLKHHEKSIWRKAFEASMQHTSIEGATRNAWKAVDAWNQANAFNESQSGEAKADGPVPLSIMREAWEILAVYIDGDPGAQQIAEAMRRFGDGLISTNDFRNQLEGEFDEPELADFSRFKMAWGSLRQTMNDNRNKFDSTTLEMSRIFDDLYMNRITIEVMELRLKKLFVSG